MKRKFLALAFALIASFAYSKDITVYYSINDYKNVLQKQFDKGLKKVIADNKKDKIIDGGSLPIHYVGWGEISMEDVSFPCMNIKLEKNEYDEYQFYIERYKDEESWKGYKFDYYTGDFSETEKIDLIQKVIEGMVQSINADSQKIETNLELIDTFDVSKYYEDNVKQQTVSTQVVCPLDDYSMLIRNGLDVHLYNPYWKQQENLRDKFSDDAKKSKYSWVAIDLGNGKIKLMNGVDPKAFIYDLKTKKMTSERIFIPDGKFITMWITDIGDIYYLDRGNNYFSSKFFRSGSENNEIKEFKFIRGMANARKEGNNGDFWISRWDGICVYDYDGKLKKIIFIDGEEDERTGLSLINKDNSFIMTDQMSQIAVKYSYDGKKLWKGKLPEVCKMAVPQKVRNGIIYFYSNGNVIRVAEMGAAVPSEFAQIAKINKSLDDVNQRIKNSASYKKLADIYINNGGIAAGYQYLKKYLEYSPADSKAQEKLLECELILAKENIKLHSNKALALYDEFGEETASDEYKAAIKILEKYRKYYPADDDLQKMYAELKTTFGQEASASTVSALEVQSVELGILFPALMNVYACEPSGVIKVKNNSKSTVKNVELKSYVRKYMDFASGSDVIQEIKAGQTVEIPIKTVLNSEAMNIEENTVIQMQLTLSWQEDNLQKKQVLTRPVTIYKKSAIVWKDTSMLSCFILPNDKSVTDFAFKSIVTNETKALTWNITNAVLLCNSVGKLPVKYVPDPAAPVTQMLGNEYAVDTVRLPFETLKLKGGDCDDLTTLLCSLFEASGIPSALVTTSGHIFAAFDTGLMYNDVWDYLPEGYAALNVDGEAWIPVEVTAVGNGFMNAWKSACKTLMEEDFEFVTVQDSMLRYQSVSAEGSGESYYKNNSSNSELNGKCFDEIHKIFIAATAEKEKTSDSAEELNEIAQVYFELYDINHAIDTLLRAYKLDPKNKAVVLNLSALYKLSGDDSNSMKYQKLAESIADKKESSSKKNAAANTRGDNKNTVSMAGQEKKSGGVSIKGKGGVVKHTRPVSSNIAGTTVTQKSIQTASSRAENKNDFKWNK